MQIFAGLTTAVLVYVDRQTSRYDTWLWRVRIRLCWLTMQFNNWRLQRHKFFQLVMFAPILLGAIYITYRIGTWGVVWEVIKWIFVLIPTLLVIIPLVFVWDIGRILC